MNFSQQNSEALSKKVFFCCANLFVLTYAGLHRIANTTVMCGIVIRISWAGCGGGSRRRSAEHGIFAIFLRAVCVLSFTKLWKKRLTVVFAILPSEPEISWYL